MLFVFSSQSEDRLAGCCQQVILVLTSFTSWVCPPVDVKHSCWIMCHSVGEAETAPVFPEWLLITYQEMAKAPNLCWIPRFPALLLLQVISRRTRACGPGKSEKTQIRIPLCSSQNLKLNQSARRFRIKQPAMLASSRWRR